MKALRYLAPYPDGSLLGHVVKCEAGVLGRVLTVSCAGHMVEVSLPTMPVKSASAKPRNMRKKDPTPVSGNRGWFFMDGLSPLTPDEVEEWTKRTGRRV